MSDSLSDDQKEVMAWIRLSHASAVNAGVDTEKFSTSDLTILLSIIDTPAADLEAERLSATTHEVAALRAQGELNSIKMMIDHIDEFGHPIDPDAKLGPIAERVHCHLVEYATELEAERGKVERLELGWGEMVNSEKHHKSLAAGTEIDLHHCAEDNAALRAKLEKMVDPEAIYEEFQCSSCNGRGANSQFTLRMDPAPSRTCTTCAGTGRISFARIDERFEWLYAKWMAEADLLRRWADITPEAAYSMRKRADEIEKMLQPNEH